MHCDVLYIPYDMKCVKKQRKGVWVVEGGKNFVHPPQVWVSLSFFFKTSAFCATVLSICPQPGHCTKVHKRGLLYFKATFFSSNNSICGSANPPTHTYTRRHTLHAQMIPSHSRERLLLSAFFSQSVEEAVSICSLHSLSFSLSLSPTILLSLPPFHPFRMY